MATQSSRRIVIALALLSAFLSAGCACKKYTVHFEIPASSDKDWHDAAPIQIGAMLLTTEAEIEIVKDFKREEIRKWFAHDEGYEPFKARLMGTGRYDQDLLSPKSSGPESTSLTLSAKQATVTEGLAQILVMAYFAVEEHPEDHIQLFPVPTKECELHVKLEKPDRVMARAQP